MITLDILGTPAPKGSSRAFMNRSTGRAVLAPGGSAVNALKIKAWSTSVREQALLALPEQCVEPVFVNTPLVVVIVFRMARPSGHWGKGKNAGKISSKAAAAPMSKPDIDKLVRATLDALTGLVFDDDSRISQLSAVKEWAMPGREGARITVEKLSVSVKTDTYVLMTIPSADSAGVA